MTIHRPWGSYRVVQEDEDWKVKTLNVEPSCRLSLQRHSHREEFWVVTSGEGKVEIEINGNLEIRFLKKSDMIHIPINTWHRLGNTSDKPFKLIEIQMGDWISESDIERKEDDYGRIQES